MLRYRHWVVLCVAAALLAWAAGWNAFAGRSGVSAVVPVKLAASIPASLPGWTTSDDHLGPTEGVSREVLKTLNFDEYVYRRYAQEGRWFTVYAAYWGPGKMPTRLVASHTPDRCWTENGMQCVEMKFRQPFTVRGRSLWPTEFRDFRAPQSNRPIHVAYWHIVDGRPYDYGNRFNAIPDPWRWWKDTVAQAMYGSREQLFVRVVSETPISDLLKEEGFQTVMTAVADAGLWERR